MVGRQAGLPTMTTGCVISRMEPLGIWYVLLRVSEMYVHLCIHRRKTEGVRTTAAEWEFDAVTTRWLSSSERSQPQLGSHLDVDGLDELGTVPGRAGST